MTIPDSDGLDNNNLGIPLSSVSLPPHRFFLFFSNLSFNAVKFTERGNVDIRAETVREDDGQVFLRFEVLDTGVGIPQDRLGSIFESFTQADGSTTRRFGGTGLGLSISRQLVQLMGGEIGAESEEGKGSTFRLTVPFKKQEGPETPMMQRQSVRGAHILIVDDNATNRTILYRNLLSFGCFPEEVSSGKDALSLLHTSVEGDRAFDAILLDHQMPGMDGEDVAREILADPALRGVRILILTSIGQRGDARKFKDLGCSAYLTKPVRQSQLLDALAEALVEEGKLTVKGKEKGDREKCLAAGMDDYISKPVKPRELLDIVQRWAGKQVFRPSL